MFPLSDDNPRHRTPVVTLSLIGSCVVVFLWQLSLGGSGEAVFYGFGMIPARLLDDAELPAGIPGAYRLFVNLLSLPQNKN